MAIPLADARSIDRRRSKGVCSKGPGRARAKSLQAQDVDPDNSSNGFKVVQIWSLTLTKKESKLNRDLESELDRDLELNVC